MHGAHKSRNVLRGANHPQYRNGERTKEVEAEDRLASIVSLTLRDIGDYVGMFQGSHTQGRKPNGYIKFNMNDPKQLVSALIVTDRKSKNKG